MLGQWGRHPPYRNPKGEDSQLFKACLSIFALSLLPLGVAAEVAQFEGKRIVDIQFAPAQILDPADLAKAQPLKKGDPLRKEDVAHAIDGLFATGSFEDIVAEVELSGEGVIVRFVTKPAWFVGGISLEGKV